MQVNAERIMKRIQDLAQFNATPGQGITRFSYSPQDAQARAYLMEQFRELGLTVRVDPMGNIRARYDGTDPALAPLWIGSHIDSVRHGGPYDGIVGVVGALETVSVFREAGHRPRRSVEVVIFPEEEGSNFGTTMVGSKCLVGKLDLHGLEQLRAEDGRTCVQVAEDFGLHPREVAKCRLQPGEVDAMVELHIEQGIVLDRKGLRLGVVQAIAGMVTVRVTVTGESNHAGATPMDMRRDPLVAAARLIGRVQEIAASECGEATVATVGEILCSPNMPNVIPGQVSFTVDIRDIRDEGIDRALELLHQAIREITDAGFTVTVETIGRNQPVALTERVVSAVREAAESCGAPYLDMNSGAVHDTSMLALVTDVGMIFIPSVDGKSHNPQEYTAPEDIALGCQVLLETALRLTA